METANVAKYFLLLEELRFEDETDTKPTQSNERLQNNLACLQKYIKEDMNLIWKKNATMLQVEVAKPLFTDKQFESFYAVQLQHALLTIVTHTNFSSEAKEDLLSTKHLNLCIKAVQEASVYSLRRNLHFSFYKNGVFGETKGKESAVDLVRMSVEFFAKILSIKQFHIANSMELVIRDYMAAIYTYYLIELNRNDAELKHLQQKLDTIWLHISKLEYFRNLMLFKSLPVLPNELQKKLHQELLQKLASEDGFATLVAVLQTAAPQQQQRKTSTQQQTTEIIANIVAFRGHSRKFQTVMVRQIFSFIFVCLRHASMMENMGVSLLALRRLYDLNAENRTLIIELLAERLKKLHQPVDVLSGLIVMEHQEFCELITLLYQLFYTSSVECLPTELLLKYLPLLLELYYNLPDNITQKQQLADLVARCLNNRDTVDLPNIVQKLYMRNFDADWQQLHERLVLMPNAAQNEVCLKIASADYKAEFSISLALPTLLMQANHAILTYQIFIALLQLMATNLLNNDDDTQLDVDLLQSEEELITLLNAKYPVKIEIILSLNTLISFQPLKSQIAENSREFLKFLRELVEQRIEAVAPSVHKSTESTDQLLLIMLTLTQEFLEQSQLPEEHRDFIPKLTCLRAQTPNILVQRRVDSLIALLSGNVKSHAVQQDSAFNTARALIESKESHLQVYGIQMLLDLLRKRDAVTLTNVHIVVALALTTLKHKESYTFLNCVRLFVALVNVMEAEVLEILSDEYLNANAEMDFRLVVGEALLKVSKELGPLTYKYKNVLLNMFINGARSPIDEFRMSAFANLAQLCRTLCYQVLTYFQELLHLVDSELSTGKYLPSKRAALLVLSELLEGIDNLIDFEEMLLPIYKLLKLIASTETCDEQLRLHATNGLKALSEKCKQFLFPEQTLQKEIRIFGIKDETKTEKKKRHILEIK